MCGQQPYVRLQAHTPEGITQYCMGIVATFGLEAAGRIPGYRWILTEATFQEKHRVPLFSQSWHKFVAAEGTCQK